MGIVLCANVGTRDVALADPSPLPESCRRGDGLVPRPTGALLTQRYAECHRDVRLPIVGKAVEHLLTLSDARDIVVVLFCSDQPESVEPRYRDNDTVHFADVIRRLLVDVYGLTKKSIRIASTDQSPADYDLMFAWYGEELLRRQHYITHDDVVYLLVSGGTPAMSMALALRGIEVFSRQAQVLYARETAATVDRLDLTRIVRRDVTSPHVRTLAKAYQYSLASKVLSKDRDLYEDSSRIIAESLLEHGAARRRLDVHSARVAMLSGIQRSRALRADMQRLVDSLPTSDADEHALLGEVVYLARLSADTENWADFLARLYRFSEGTLQLTADSLGVRFTSTSRQYYELSWWHGNQGLLVGARVPTDDRRTNRENLSGICRALAAASGMAGCVRGLDELAVVGSVLGLRNDIVHRFAPVSRADIEGKGHTVDELIASMREAYGLCLGRALRPEDPYQVVNALVGLALAGKT